MESEEARRGDPPADERRCSSCGTRKRPDVDDQPAIDELRSVAIEMAPFLSSVLSIVSLVGVIAVIIALLARDSWHGPNPVSFFERLGQVGDSFGWLGALGGVSAFAISCLSLVVQRREARIQRADFEESLRAQSDLAMRAEEDLLHRIRPILAVEVAGWGEVGQPILNIANVGPGVAYMVSDKDKQIRQLMNVGDLVPIVLLRPGMTGDDDDTEQTAWDGKEVRIDYFDVEGNRYMTLVSLTADRKSLARIRSVPVPIGMTGSGPGT